MCTNLNFYSSVEYLAFKIFECVHNFGWISCLASLEARAYLWKAANSTYPQDPPTVPSGLLILWTIWVFNLVDDPRLYLKGRGVLIGYFSLSTHIL